MPAAASSVLLSPSWNSLLEIFSEQARLDRSVRPLRDAFFASAPEVLELGALESSLEVSPAKLWRIFCNVVLFLFVFLQRLSSPLLLFSTQLVFGYIGFILRLRQVS